MALGGAASPPAMFDNLQEIQAKYRESLADYQADRTNALNTLTTRQLLRRAGVSAAGGHARAVEDRLGRPSLGACDWRDGLRLVIGAILMDPARLKSGGDVAVAFLPFNIAPPEMTATSSPADNASGPIDQALGDQAGPVPDAAVMEMDAFGLGFAGKKEDVAAVPAAAPVLAFGAPAVPAEMFDMGADRRRRPVLRQGSGTEGLGPLAGGIGQATGRQEEKYADIAKKLDEQLARYRFTVREYAHEHAPVVGDAGVRSDFAETLFWHPLLVTDKEGRAEDRLRSVRLDHHVPPAGRRPRRRANRLGRCRTDLADPVQPRTETPAGGERRRPHRPAVGRGQRHEGPAAGRAAAGARRSGLARRRSAPQAGAGGRETRPRVLQPGSDRSEGRLRVDHPRHGRPPGRRRDPPAEGRSARLPEENLAQRPDRRSAAGRGRTARDVGARLAGGDAQRVSLPRWPTCRRGSRAFWPSPTGASSRRRRRTTPTCCRCSTCRSTTWPTRPSRARRRTC